MGRPDDRHKHETRGAARRAWLAGLLVWTFVLQLLIPVLGPVRAGDGTATAALGRVLPICTLAGLRLAEPITSETGQGSDLAVVDGGWQCLLCAIPALPTPTGVATAPAVAWTWVDWPAPTRPAPPGERLHRPQTARGPPAIA